MSGIDGSVEQMTQGHLRNVQQLAVFFTGNNNVYAINIAKVKAFMITDEITINDTPSETDIISGIATIRGEPVTLINLDIWLGMKPLDLKDYQLIIYCEYSNKKVGFLIKAMHNIVEKTTEELRHSEETNSKITYTTYVKVEDKNELCTVFNAEQLLTDIGFSEDTDHLVTKYVEHPIQTDKLVLAAEDSGVARDILQKFFEQAELNYEIYNNGKEIMKRIEEIDAQDVGLIISDIEMPGADGYQVATYIKSNDSFAHIPVIINSSMTTEAVKYKMREIGVDGFVGKTNIEQLYRTVKALILH